jgi:hypothetical protein
MKKRVLSYLTYGNHFYSVEQTQINDEICYYGIELKRSKNQVEVVKSFQFNQLKDASTHIPKHKPVALVINNNFVITKKIESRETDDLKLLHTAFPNIKINDFYYEILKQDSIHFVSICRKLYLYDLLKEFQTHHISFIDFSLGNLILSTISELIPEDSICTNNANIKKENNQIISINANLHPVEVFYEFNDTILNNSNLLNFSSALGLITKVKKTEFFFGSKQKVALTHFKEKQFFNQFMKIGLSSLFILLLVNFFLFNNYYTKVNKLRGTAEVLITSKTKLVSLNDKVQKTQKVLEDILKSNSSKSSFYLDAFTQSLPNSILMSEFNYQPLSRKIKDNKPIENDTNTILVSGSTLESITLSEWISKLESFSWIKKIEIINFEDTSKSSSEFTLKVSIQ